VRRTLPLAVLLFACSGEIVSRHHSSSPVPNESGGGSAGGVESGGGMAAGGAPTDGASNDAGTEMPWIPVYARAGIRRLSQSEVNVAGSALLGISAQPLAAALGTDTRQNGFTRNSDQRLGSVQADALWQATAALAHEAVLQKQNILAPCATVGGSEACAQTFIHNFASKAYRRLLVPTEEAALLAVYRAGRLDGTYATGLELVIQAVLQSASFLYATELGTTAAQGLTRLSGEEIATSLALLFTGAPADEALLAKGRMGELNDGPARQLVARQLAVTPLGRKQLSRLILEWLALDDVDVAPKEIALFPQWASVRNDVLSESELIIQSVLFDGDSSLKTLLTTPQTVVTPALASFYQLTNSGSQMQPSFRRGLLLAGGFSAANSHPNSTAPVKRGAVVRKKLLCQELPLPMNTGTPIVVPAPNPNQTTRERFAAHSASPSCASCHNLLDPIGFALENFDPIGRYRTMENSKPIDPSGTLVSAGDADGSFQNAVGLVTLLANSKTVAECFEHQVFRFASGRAGVDEERTFIKFVKNRPSAVQVHIVELLVDYAQSDSFVLRSAQ
jgi:hypothetical protein